MIGIVASYVARLRRPRPPRHARRGAPRRIIEPSTAPEWWEL